MRSSVVVRMDVRRTVIQSHRMSEQTHENVSHFPPEFILRAWAPDAAVRKAWVWDRVRWSENFNRDLPAEAQRGTSSSGLPESRATGGPEESAGRSPAATAIRVPAARRERSRLWHPDLLMAEARGGFDRSP